MPRYDFKRIETRWQQFWETNETFRTPETSPGGETFYVLDMFPYPSGNGLHVGHPEGYTATDIVSRYYRMRGRHVLHPMGWDAFGLPAEQHAIRTGTHPRETTNRNIDNFRRQLKMLGFSYDWSREVATTDPGYFRWTQWIFLELFDTWYDPDNRWTGPDGQERTGRGRPIAELPIPNDILADGETAVRRYQDRHRLAYQHEAPVNWCPELGTVLSNEEVNAAGRSERGSHPVVRIPLRQWMLRITAYAERLIDELADLNWSESIKILQRNWIGRSEGADVDFYIGSADDLASGGESFNAAREHWQAERAASGFPAEPNGDVLRIYTTRPDTLFGATYMVLAPEHPFVERLTTAEHREEVAAYGRQAATKSDLDRTDLAKEKTGVFTGSFAINPVSGEQIPIWIADYVLISYGTGAIMAVPAHDLRDWEFAVTFDLPIVPVVEPPAGYQPTKEERALAASDSDGLQPAGLCPFAGEGTAIHSGEYDGLKTAEFRRKITADLLRNGLGRGAVNYRLRDWLFSRQHFWGEPFPIWHELDAEGNPTGLLRTDSADCLPITLPERMEFKPTGTPDPPLAKAPDDWLYKTDADGTRLLRETNTMPQWAGSCWYYLRFLDPHNSERFVDPEKEKHWMPVDLYIGGAEHAVLHLLYARFWHKVLFDRGHVSTAEPFQRLVNQGMILGEAELTGYVRVQSPESRVRDEKKVSGTVFSAGDEGSVGGWVSAEGVRDGLEVASGEAVTAVQLEADQVTKQGERFVLKENPAIAVESRAYKMSKSRGNVINPDDIVAEYGADSLRLYEMFMGPLEQMKPWNMAGVEGVSRFLGRVWRMIVDDRAEDVCFAAAVQDVEPTEEQSRVLHRTIKAVTEDIEKLSFNTAISRMMEFTNAISRQDPRPRAVLEPFVLLLSPFAPHVAEELWRLFGHAESLAYHPWPTYDEQRIAEAEVEIPVQINGKLRSRVKVPADADQEAIRRAAEADETIGRNLAGKTIVKVIVVPGRLVNFVVKGG